MDDTTRLNELVDDGLLARIETFSDAVLSPDPAAMARMRAGVVAAAAASATRAAVGPAAPVGRGWFGGLFGGGLRRPAVGLVGASLLVALLAGGAMAGSAPGGPFYQARLWIETVTLPSDPGARTDAEIARLQNRLDEAASAAAHGNGAAVSAALQAYRDTIDATMASAGGDLTREEHLQIVLEKHRVVLETLAANIDDPGQATDAIERVLAKNAETIERIVSGETPAGQPGGNPAAPGQAEPPGQVEPPGQGGGKPSEPGKGSAPGQSAAPGQVEPPGQGGGKPAEPPGRASPDPAGQTAPTERPRKTPKPTTP